jgi:toxin-antitoxin system PIN domain toxin
MQSFDTNILFYATNPHSKFFEPAQRHLKSLSQRDDVVVAELVLVEFYVLLRNPTVMKHPLSAEEASSIISTYRYHPRWRVIENADVMDEVWQHASRKDFSRRRIFDTRLALTLIAHGVTHFATANVKDFVDYPFQEVFTP